MLARTTAACLPFLAASLLLAAPARANQLLDPRFSCAGHCGDSTQGLYANPPTPYCWCLPECALQGGAECCSDYVAQCGTPRGLLYTPAPVVVDVSPAHGPTAGGTQLSVSGAYFLEPGQCVVEPKAFLGGTGGLACALDGHHDRTLQCTTSPGQGRDLRVLVQVCGQLSRDPVSFSYDAPSIEGIRPLLIDTVGGTFVAHGKNFGQTPQVLVDGRVATSTVDAAGTRLDVDATGLQGQGTSTVTVVVGGQSASAALGRNPPSIDPVAPLPAGGGSITLTGKNFGVGASVALGAATCPVTAQSDGQLTCTAPPKGAANEVLVEVTVANRTGSRYAQYDPGSFTLTGITSTSTPAAGGVPLMLAGTGLDAAGLGVVVGAQACEVRAQSATSTTCTLPPGLGRGLLVRATAGSATSTALLLDYDPPQVTAFSASSTPTAGGTPLTVFGRNFGPGGSSLVSVGGAACTPLPSPPSGDTSVTCLLPPGEGVAAVEVMAAGQRGVAAQPLLYDAPHIAGVTPQGGPTAGDALLTIDGTSFGLHPQVLVGGTPCPLVESSHSRVRCTLPAGGGNLTLELVAAGRSATSTYSYAPPAITQLLPTGGPSDGGGLLHLDGLNLGTRTPVVQVGTQGCAVEAHTQTTIDCWLPKGAGAAAVTVVVAEQLSNTLTYTYAPPAVGELFPAHGPAAGGTEVLVRGESLGGGARLRAGGVLVTPSSQFDRAVVFTMPAGAGGAVSVELERAGEASSATFTYDPPQLTRLDPAALPWGGGALALEGQGFGTAPSVTVGGRPAAVTAHTDGRLAVNVPASSGAEASDAVVVTAGGAPSNALPLGWLEPTVSGLDPRSGPTAGGTTLALAGTSLDRPGLEVKVGGRPCPVTARLPAALRCTLPEGAGGQPVVLWRGPVAVPAGAFRYDAPSISNVQGQGGPTAGGAPIVLAGTNLGPPGSASLVFAGKPVPLTLQSQTQVSFTLPAGEGGTVPLVLAVGDAQATASYTYGAPSIHTVAAPSAPTAGGAPLALAGTNLGSGAATSLTIGGAPCAGLTSTHTALTCTLPAGQGEALPLVLTVAGQSASTTFAYEAPVLESASPQALAAAGGTLALAGRNFGTSATATVGGRPCPVVSQTHTRLVCDAPAGAGTQPVLLKVGARVAGGPTVTYPALVLQEVRPPSAPAAGGALLLLRGEGFVAPTVAVGGAPCPLVRSTSTEIVCRLPALAKGAAAVAVTSQGATATLAAFTATATCGTDLTDGAPCDDGDPCTGDGTCRGRACLKGAPANDGAACAGLDPCTGPGTCAAGRCTGQAAQREGRACASANFCLEVGSCTAGLCLGLPAHDGEACDDGDPATSGDVCHLGYCAGAAVAPDGGVDAGSDGGQGPALTGAGCSSTGASGGALLLLLAWAAAARSRRRASR